MKAKVQEEKLEHGRKGHHPPTISMSHKLASKAFNLGLEANRQRAMVVPPTPLLSKLASKHRGVLGVSRLLLSLKPPEESILSVAEPPYQ